MNFKVTWHSLQALSHWSQGKRALRHVFIYIGMYVGWEGDGLGAFIFKVDLSVSATNKAGISDYVLSHHL